MNIRAAIAIEVAEQIGAEVLKELCPDCEAPLLEKAEQGMPFCWMCVTDRMAAQRARDTLTKVKLAAQGIIIEITRDWPEQKRYRHPADKEDQEPRGPFKFGMPL